VTESSTRAAGPNPELKALRESSRGKGVVWLAWDDDWHWYWGYWELSPDGPPTVLEHCPSSPDATEVVEWGHARTPVVVIRPESDPGRHYWAGLGPRPDRCKDLPTFDPEAS
jgi:hypothetical protein